MRLRKAPIVLATLAVPLAGCSGVLDPHGPVGASEKLILFDSLAIMLAIVIPTMIATVAFAWWFRASNVRARYRPNWAYSGTLELIVWAIPALVITFLGGIAWFGSAALDPYRPLPSKDKAIEVEVVSLDWKWLFIYPNDHIATVNQLVIPAGVPVHFSMTSSGVMNSFFVPQLGSQVYTMANMTSQLYLQADHVGTYHGLSAQFSGQGFVGMHFDVRAVSPADYAKWIADTQVSGGKVLDQAAYTELEKQSMNVPPTLYSNVAPKLFEDIVAEKLPSSQKNSGEAGQDHLPAPK